MTSWVVALCYVGVVGGVKRKRIKSSAMVAIKVRVTCRLVFVYGDQLGGSTMLCEGFN